LAEELEILHQDEAIAVVNKPSGMLVHRGWDQDPIVAMTVVRDRLGRYVHPVHRLDRPTSGALVFALSREHAASLGEAFRERNVSKRYIALVRGIAPAEVLVDSPVPKKPKGPRFEAQTEIRRLEKFEERYSLVEARPLTGRLHQIRRHLAHLSHPIIGDVNYGDGRHNRLFRQRFGLWRLALHAFEIDIPHPLDGRRLVVRAAIPADLAEPLERMGFDVEALEARLAG
jgi:tRNA pseudouridine65 synthase